MADVVEHPQAVYGLIGHPVQHVRSPSLFNERLGQWNLPGRMVAFDFAPDDLEAGLAGLRVMRNLVGFLVTMPYKEAILGHLDGMTDEVRASGAANIVRRAPDGQLFGGQLDGAGFVAAMRLLGTDPAGRRVFVAGAGGVSAGICAALAAAGAARIDLYNRTAARSAALASRLQAAYPDCRIVTDETAPGRATDIVINATSLGLKPEDALPLSLDDVNDGIFVGDVVNTPEPTPLLRLAAARGCVVQGGRAMVEPQMALMRGFFAGRRGRPWGTNE